jgi:hypothetical protein
VPQVESQLSSRLDVVESSIKDIMKHVMQNQNTNFKLVMDGIVALQTKMAHDSKGILEASSVQIDTNVLGETKRTVAEAAIEGTRIAIATKGTSI